jgi:hypothetical protein
VKRFLSIGVVVIVVALLSLLFFLPVRARSAATIYDSDPNHLWNRLAETLFARCDSASNAPAGPEYGLDEPDILYWVHTDHLLTEPSHHQAIAVLDEFIQSHGEKLITDPLKRALLQRDLWELFDWTAPTWNHANERRELQSRLAVVIRRLALTTNEIAFLPDNYVRAEKPIMEKDPLPDLPRGLFDTNGDWVNLAPANFFEEIAPAHDHGFGACAPFLVFMRAPGGRAATTNYLNRLDSFQRVWVYATNEFNGNTNVFLTFSRDLPQFPAGTEFALVRRMCVIDTDGNIVPTRIVVSIQKRRYKAIAGPTFIDEGNNRYHWKYPMDFYEFRMQRARAAALRAVSREEGDFVQFDSKGFDPFQGNPFSADHESVNLSAGRPLLNTCTDCHQAAGIYSVNSYVRLFSPQFTEPPKLLAADPVQCIQAAIDWKRQQYDWGLLQGLWQR